MLTDHLRKQFRQCRRYTKPKRFVQFLQEALLLLAGTISIELIEAESANAILVSKNRGLVDMRAAIESMLELSSNNIKMMPQNELISEAFETAESYKASVYDLLYVSLAKRTSSSLASKDEKQKEIARKAKVKIEEV